MGENDWPGGYRAIGLAVVALAGRTSVLPWQSRRAQGGVGAGQEELAGQWEGRPGGGEVSISRGGCFAHVCAVIQGCEGATGEEAWAPASPKKWQQKAAALPAKVPQRPSLHLAWTRSHHVTSLYR